MLKLGKLLPALDKIKLLDLLVKLKLKNSILLVIMYHEVGRDIYYDKGISEQLFDNEIKYLIKLRFKILPLMPYLNIIGNAFS